MVRNYPILSELEPPADAAPYVDRPPRVAYVGGIGLSRGCLEMARAVASLPATIPVELAMGGWFAPPSFEAELRSAIGADRLALLGTLDREGVQQLLGSSRVGLILDHPTQAYLRSFPVKMFEYMAAGVPIVASDFPLWKEIIGEAGCGLLADPRDPAQIADAIQTLLSDPVAARAMGQRGREAVVERFNWVPEAAALVALYAKLVGGP
jgi:glycosyltransferase involved in cell wall biosynthesis